MTGSELAIVIGGKHEDWPGGAKALTPRDPTRDPNGTFWFGAELVPDSRQVWFRITEEAIAPDTGGDANGARPAPGRHPPP